MSLKVSNFFTSVLVISVVQSSYGVGRKWVPVFENTNKSQAALPSAEKSVFEQTQRVDPKLLKPIRSSVVLRSDNEDYNQLSRILDQQIQELNRMLKKTSQGQKPELWARLGGLYVEKADLTKRLIDQKFDRDQKVGRQKSGAIDYKPAYVFSRRAIELYQQFLKEVPKNRVVDQALFFLGFSYFELGQYDQGQRYFKQLIEQYPRSQFIGEARFAMAEYQFEADQFKAAGENYSYVIQKGASKFNSYARYKLAWCQFRLNQAKAAIISLEKVLQAGADSPNARRIEGEAKRDLVLFYAEGGNAERAVSYFESLYGATDSLSYLEKLAYAYADRGEKKAAQTVFEHLINKKTVDPKTFDYQYQIVKMYLTAKDHSAFREQVIRWVRGFGTKSHWFDSNRANTVLIEKSNKLMESTLRTWVLQQHQTAQNSRAIYSQKLALDGYRLYFAAFKESDQNIDLHFFYAELLYDMGKFDEASLQYRLVVEGGSKSQYRSQAAINLLIAAEKSLPKDEELAKVVGDRTDRVELGPAIENYIKQAQWFLTQFPQDKKAAEVEFRVARLYYQHNHFDQSTPLFKKIVRQYPDTKYSEYAANLLLDTYNLRKDYEGLAAVSKELLAIPHVARSSVGKEINAIQDRVAFKQAQELENKGQIKESAIFYENYAKSHPNSELTSTALYNAAINFSRVNLGAKSIEMIEKLNRYTDPKAQNLKEKTLGLLPMLYRESGRLPQAADSYYKAAEVQKSKSEQRNLYYNAAVLYAALEKKEAAIQAYEKAYRLSGPKDAAVILFELAELHRQKNQRAVSLRYYEDYLNSGHGTEDNRVTAAYWLSQNGPQNDREKWARTVIRLQSQATGGGSLVARRWAAKIELEKVQTLLQAQRRIRLNDFAKLKNLMDQKLNYIEQINKQSAVTIKVGAPEETLDAVKVVAEANWDLYQGMMESPVPGALKKPEDIKKYRDGVAEIALPFKQKSLEAYQLILQRSSEFETYNSAYFQARRFLAGLESSAIYEKGQMHFEVYQMDGMGL